MSAGLRGPAALLERATALAGAVPDPELPVVTLAQLGILRRVELTGSGRVAVILTPTYSGCPAVEVMCRDVVSALDAGGLPGAEVRLERTPPWSTDDITAEGCAALAAAGFAPAPPAPPVAPAGTRLLPLLGAQARPAPRCPRCGGGATREVSHFGPTPCTALHACTSCGEPFPAVKPL